MSDRLGPLASTLADHMRQYGKHIPRNILAAGWDDDLAELVQQGIVAEGGTIVVIEDDARLLRLARGVPIGE